MRRSALEQLEKEAENRGVSVILLPNPFRIRTDKQSGILGMKLFVSSAGFGLQRHDAVSRNAYLYFWDNVQVSVKDGHDDVIVINNTGDIDKVDSAMIGRWNYKDIVTKKMTRAATDDKAQLNNGGIDFKPDKVDSAFAVKMDSRLRGNDKNGIQFHLDPAMLEQLQNAPGFVPVIINIQPMGDIRLFLGIKENAPNRSSPVV